MSWSGTATCSLTHVDDAAVGYAHRLAAPPLGPKRTGPWSLCRRCIWTVFGTSPTPPHPPLRRHRWPRLGRAHPPKRPCQHYHRSACGRFRQPLPRRRSQEPAAAAALARSRLPHLYRGATAPAHRRRRRRSSATVACRVWRRPYGPRAHPHWDPSPCRAHCRQLLPCAIVGLGPPQVRFQTLWPPSRSRHHRHRPSLSVPVRLTVAMPACVWADTT
jgi:hypothetical protein